MNINDLRFGRYPSGAIGILSIPRECVGTYVPRDSETDTELCDDSLTPEPGHDALADRHGSKINDLNPEASWR